MNKPQHRDGIAMFKIELHTSQLHVTKIITLMVGECIFKLPIKFSCIKLYSRDDFNNPISMCVYINSIGMEKKFMLITFNTKVLKIKHTN